MDHGIDNAENAPTTRAHSTPVLATAALTIVLLFACNDDVFAQKRPKKIKNKDLPEMLRTGDVDDARKRQKTARKANENAAGVCPAYSDTPPPLPVQKPQTIEFTHQTRVIPVVVEPPVQPKKRKHLRNN